jgi:hypothetical protein
MKCKGWLVLDRNGTFVPFNTVLKVEAIPAEKYPQIGFSRTGAATDHALSCLAQLTPDDNRFKLMRRSDSPVGEDVMFFAKATTVATSAEVCGGERAVEAGRGCHDCEGESKEAEGRSRPLAFYRSRTLIIIGVLEKITGIRS